MNNKNYSLKGGKIKLAKNNKSKNSSQGDSNLFAFLGIFLTVIGFIIVKITKPKDKYAMHYAKQGLVLGIIALAIWILRAIIPFSFIGILASILSFATFILWIIGIIYSFSGEQKEIPLIGEIAKKF